MQLNHETPEYRMEKLPANGANDSEWEAHGIHGWARIRIVAHETHEKTRKESEGESGNEGVRE